MGTTGEVVWEGCLGWLRYPPWEGSTVKIVAQNGQEPLFLSEFTFPSFIREVMSFFSSSTFKFLKISLVSVMGVSAVGMDGSPPLADDLVVGLVFRPSVERV